MRVMCVGNGLDGQCVERKSQCVAFNALFSNSETLTREFAQGKSYIVDESRHMRPNPLFHIEENVS